MSVYILSSCSVAGDARSAGQSVPYVSRTRPTGEINKQVSLGLPVTYICL